MSISEFSPGPIVLMGSGETSTSSGTVFEKAASQYQPPVKISILETPAGFELNSARVAGRVADYLRIRLQNNKPHISVIAARRKETEFSPDAPEILEALYESDMFFMGPGSPTYTAKQLTGSLAYEIIRAKHRLGSALVLASAATIAFGCQTLPVYEIFKAGMDLHWQPGLDFFSDYGLSLIIIPHWNNAEGGAELDTSRCFMGKDRFEILRTILPCKGTLLGIDEHTSLWIDLINNQAKVFGKDSVHIFKNGEELHFASGNSIPLSLLGKYAPLGEITSGIRNEIWQNLEKLTVDRLNQKIETPSNEILELIQQREAARAVRNFTESDRLRKKVEEFGWRLVDTPTGPQVDRI
jgi:hypothetical protein